MNVQSAIDIKSLLNEIRVIGVADEDRKKKSKKVLENLDKCQSNCIDIISESYSEAFGIEKDKNPGEK